MTIMTQERKAELMRLRDEAANCDDWRAVDEYDKELAEAVVSIATVELHERGMAILRDKVDALNKRARRHGMVELEMRILSAEPCEREVGIHPVTRKKLFAPDVLYRVEIVGCEPCINGWKLAAKVEFNDIIGNVVRIAPGRDDDGSYVAYRTIGPVCEHCNTNRRRNDVFVLEDGDGNRKIIGRNCLADYLRSGDADDLARWAEWMDQLRRAADGECDDSEGYENFGRSNPAMPLGAYLRVVAVAKRKFGWMGRTVANNSYDGVATADIAGRILYGKGKAHERWIAENDLVPNEDDGAYVEKAIEWAKGIDDGGNEYRHTIKAIALAGYVDMRKLDGYAASILVAHDKALEREIEYAARKAAAKDREMYGDAKKRYRNIPVKCVGLNSFEGHYGVTTLVRFEHYPDGPNGKRRAVLTWFASGDKYNDWDLDAEYAIDFTVKGHEDHEKYGAQTRINRVKQL